MRFTTWLRKERSYIWYTAFLLSQSTTLLRPHDREFQTRQRGSCPRRTNTRRTTERPRSRSIRENGAYSSVRLSGTSSRWRVPRDSRLRRGMSSGAGKSGQMRRRRAGARLEKRAAQSLILSGSGRRKRERCASYSRRSQRKLAWRASLQVRWLFMMGERELC